MKAVFKRQARPEYRPLMVEVTSDINCTEYDGDGGGGGEAFLCIWCVLNNLSCQNRSCKSLVYKDYSWE